MCRSSPRGGGEDGAFELTLGVPVCEVPGPARRHRTQSESEIGPRVAAFVLGQVCPSPLPPTSLDALPQDAAQRPFRRSKCHPLVVSAVDTESDSVCFANVSRLKQCKGQNRCHYLSLKTQFWQFWFSAMAGRKGRKRASSSLCRSPGGSKGFYSLWGSARRHFMVASGMDSELVLETGINTVGR